MQSLQKYLETGEPIQVIMESGLLAPYTIQKRDLTNRSSGIGPQTEITYAGCLERIPGEPFNPKDFKKYSREKIFHLCITMNFNNMFSSISAQEQYVYMRMASEVAAEMHGVENPFSEKWEDIEEWKKQQILNALPEKKIDFAWETMRSISDASSSDCIGIRQRKPWTTDITPVLYEIKFNQAVPGIDIYLKRPTVEEATEAIRKFKARRVRIKAKSKKSGLPEFIVGLDDFG